MTDDFFWLDGVSDEDIRRERGKARDLRKTRWWQRKTASGKCYYCDESVNHQDLTMDHLIPLSRGGRSTKDNLVPLSQVDGKDRFRVYGKTDCPRCGRLIESIELASRRLYLCQGCQTGV